jgi:hypothetical protein
MSRSKDTVEITQGMDADASGNFDIDGTLTVNGNKIEMPNVSSTTKYQLWNTSMYAIGMSTSYTFGGLTNYVTTFTMNDTVGRGWLFRDSTQTNAQGWMGITNSGELTVADSARIGYGEDDVTTPGATYKMDVNGSVSATSYYGDGSSLTGISAGATGGSTDQVFYENDQEVTTNYTISTNKNAMTAGPITVNAGVTVTIPTGSEWSIV